MQKNKKIVVCFYVKRYYVFEGKNMKGRDQFEKINEKVR